MIQLQPNQTLANIKETIAQQLARFDLLIGFEHFTAVELLCDA